MKFALFACDVMLKYMLFSVFEFAPAAQSFQHSLCCPCFGSLVSSKLSITWDGY